MFSLTCVRCCACVFIQSALFYTHIVWLRFGILGCNKNPYSIFKWQQIKSNWNFIRFNWLHSNDQSNASKKRYLLPTYTVGSWNVDVWEHFDQVTNEIWNYFKMFSQVADTEGNVCPNFHCSALTLKNSSKKIITRYIQSLFCTLGCNSCWTDFYYIHYKWQILTCLQNHQRIEKIRYFVWKISAVSEIVYFFLNG